MNLENIVIVERDGGYTTSPTPIPIPYFLFLFPIPIIFHIPYSLFHIRYSIFHIPYSLFPYSLFHIPYSIFHIPYSLFPIPYSLFHIPYSIFPIPFFHIPYSIFPNFISIPILLSSCQQASSRQQSELLAHAGGKFLARCGPLVYHTSGLFLSELANLKEIQEYKSKISPAWTRKYSPEPIIIILDKTS